MSVDAIVARGHDRATVKRSGAALPRRIQAPPGPAGRQDLTRRNFGRDRRYPITNSTSYGVEQDTGFRRARLSWWDVHPEDWEPLHQWHEQTAASFDALLPARSATG
jgi:hypothetical protein